MEEKQDFPKSAKEFYDNLIALNKLNDMKITMEAVEKLYKFLLEVKEDNKHLEIYSSVEYGNSENKLDRKTQHRLDGTCPNCGNGLSSTGGTCLSKKMSIYENGAYCLNCGKIYGREGRSKTYIEKDEPIFYRTTLRS